jgi:hypothetical protein
VVDFETDVDAPTKVFEQRCPLYVDGFEYMSFDELNDIRRSNEFQEYLKAYGDAVLGDRIAVEKFEDELHEYMEFLKDRLAPLVTGDSRGVRYSSNVARICRYVTDGGSTIITLSSVGLPNFSMGLAALGICWYFAGAAITQRELNRAAALRRKARGVRGTLESKREGVTKRGFDNQNAIGEDRGQALQYNILFFRRLSAGLTFRWSGTPQKARRPSP